jgi:PTS system mannitol-specific IIC component
MKIYIYRLTNFIQIIITKNMGFFIALGIFRMLSFKWKLSLEIIEILIRYIVPIVIAYTTGNLIEKKYGAMSSVLASTIFLVKYDSGSILIIILLSAISSNVVKIVKEKVILKYFPSLEMLGLNLLIPFITVISGFLFIDMSETLDGYLQRIFIFFLEFKENIWFIFLITPIIEISKVFFFNNLINHGILFFLGYEEMIEKGSSIFFLLETNPGPGLGVLLAYFLLKKEKKGIMNSIILEFIGGIHEFYFPYIVKNLKLIFSIVIGAFFSNLIFYFFNVTLYSLPSPGSIITILLFSKKKVFFLILGIFLSTLISFVISYFILKGTKESKISDEGEKIKKIERIDKIGIVCIGGVGTSSIVKNYLLNELKKQNLPLKVENYSLLELENDVDVVLTHKNLIDQVRSLYPNKLIITLENYLDREFYKKFIEKYIKNNEIVKKDKITILVEPNQKKLSQLANNKKEEILFNNGIGLIDRDENRNKIEIRHYPYGVNYKGKEIFLLVSLYLNKEKKEKVKNILRNLDETIIKELEIIDTKDEIIKILNLEKILDLEV